VRECVSDSHLESVLLGACPELRESWRAHRGTFSGTETATDQQLIDAVRRHVVGLLTARRVAEFSRFTRTMERVLGEADPMLEALLREELIEPLVRDVGGAKVPDSLVTPYLGPRLAAAWRADR